MGSFGAVVTYDTADKIDGMKTVNLGKQVVTLEAKDALTKNDTFTIKERCSDATIASADRTEVTVVPMYVCEKKGNGTKFRISGTAFRSRKVGDYPSTAKAFGDVAIADKGDYQLPATILSGVPLNKLAEQKVEFKVFDVFVGDTNTAKDVTAFVLGAKVVTD